ncbi:MAG TPA: UDP-N-acetylmuramate--L-alanine ligase [bacterium]|nr:UDP-N-acetylmuramate--L-alanine ligase [bacterium]
MQIAGKNIQRVHFTGIKGVGMAGLAIIAKQMGLDVSGSDVTDEFITDQVLATRGIAWQPGFDPHRVETVDLVVATGAHGGKTNPEAQAAQEQGIPVLMHAEALSLFAQGKKVIAVAGCHGKTTTSALLSWVLTQAGYEPSFLVGTSEITGLGFAAAFGKGEYFVIEADEYMTCPQTDRTPRFLYLDPFISLITNIEHDHPDRYATLAETKLVFKQFINKTPQDGLIVACTDSEPLRSVLAEQRYDAPVATYGSDEEADWQVLDFKSEHGFVSWRIKQQETVSETFCLQVPGLHNALNATGVLRVLEEIGLPPAEASGHLCSFKGLKRRFEFIGERNGVKVYDDYAHHPSEIKATLRAAREWFPGQRIIVVFQAHTYSRTQVLFSEFSQAFTDADQVIIPKIFPSAREKDTLGMTAAHLAQGIQRYHDAVMHIEDVAEIQAWLHENTTAGDILITMGAGDIYHLGTAFLNT